MDFVKLWLMTTPDEMKYMMVPCRFIFYVVVAGATKSNRESEATRYIKINKLEQETKK